MEVVEIGFPQINGYVMHTHIEASTPNIYVLWFHKHSDDLATLIDVRIFLFSASLQHAHVELNPNFPFVDSYCVSSDDADHSSRKHLIIRFEKGEMRFEFENSMYTRSVKPLGPVKSSLSV